jgi:hypothetical protein
MEMSNRHSLTESELQRIADGTIWADTAELDERDRRAGMGAPDHDWTAASPAELADSWMDSCLEDAKKAFIAIREDRDSWRVRAYWWRAAAFGLGAVMLILSLSGCGASLPSSAVTLPDGQAESSRVTIEVLPVGSSGYVWLAVGSDRRVFVAKDQTVHVQPSLASTHKITRTERGLVAEIDPPVTITEGVRSFAWNHYFEPVVEVRVVPKGGGQ